MFIREKAVHKLINEVSEAHDRAREAQKTIAGLELELRGDQKTIAGLKEKYRSALAENRDLRSMSWRLEDKVAKLNAYLWTLKGR